MSAAFGEGGGDSSDSEAIRFNVRNDPGPANIEFSAAYTAVPRGGPFAFWDVSPLWEGAANPPVSDVELALRDPAFLQMVAETISGSIGRREGEPKSAGDGFDSEIGGDRSRGLLAAVGTVHFARNARIHLATFADEVGLSDFMIFAPENTLLRTPPPEGVVLPLGCKGEGLFRHLESFGEPERERELADMKERLRIFGWFEDFLAPDRAAVAQARLQIRDRWLAPGRAVIDQRSANEGFLYLLFYFALMMSPRTPRFFAIDNLDNALNPKLCAALMRQITELAARYGKQVICTTHNPAILDGLDLHDEGQRLYSVQRDEDGRTTVNRVRPPKPLAGQAPVKLSAAFLAGYIGGLPEHF